jgi:Tfp pilus assembly protein PilX
MMKERSVSHTEGSPNTRCAMLTVGMVVLALVTFLAMVGFVALCDRV